MAAALAGRSGTENGYYALLALGAPDGADGIEHARAWLDGRVRRKRTGWSSRRPSSARSADPATPRVSCLAAVRRTRTKSRPNGAYREDLVRYETLIGFKRYEGAGLPAARLDGLSAVRIGDRCAPRVCRCAPRSSAARERRSRSRGDRRDIAFKRAMLSGARTLLGKIVAASTIGAVAFFPIDAKPSGRVRPHVPRIREMLTSTGTHRRHGGGHPGFAFRRRCSRTRPRRDVEARRSLLEDGGELLYKPNATLNREVEHLAAVAARRWTCR
jgi:hypothetical protein